MPLAHKLITAWFVLTAPVILWDAGYCLMRPRSMKGGDLHWIWKPYAIYQEVDYVYGVRALENNEGFTSAQAFLNLIETALNLYYVYLWNIASSPAAPVIGFAAVTMTVSKTLLYFAQEYYCGWCSIGHNTMQDLVFLYIIPDGTWLLFPTLIAWKLGKDISASLHASSKKAGIKKE